MQRLAAAMRRDHARLDEIGESIHRLVGRAPAGGVLTNAVRGPLRVARWNDSGEPYVASFRVFIQPGVEVDVTVTPRTTS